MANEYKYLPLPDKKSIRVLILDPGKGDKPLSGVLEVIHLRSRRRDNCSSLWDKLRRKTSSTAKIRRWKTDVPYEAISYVWGSDRKDHTILLSGKTHQITTNLSDALHQCRLPDQSRALWADSICIDQDRLDEKGHQVYMMGRIYASSQRTLICLGYDNQDHARDASSLIADVNKMLQETFNSPDFSWEVDCFPWPLPGDPLVNDSRRQSIDILFRHPWFSRGWIVQEAALGRESLILWAGRKFSLSDATRADVWYSRRVSHLKERRYREKSIPFLLRQVWLHSQKAEARVFCGLEIWVEDCDILFALHYARDLGLRDPRDRIFAFMALPFVRNTMPDPRPDYKQSHQELYQKFAIKYLEETSDLNLLSYASDEKSYDEALDGASGSTWVPRWDHLHWFDYGNGHHSEKRNFGQETTKSANFVIFLGENGASASLQVRAVIFDSIRLVSPHFEASMTIKDLATFWSHWSKQAGFGIDSRQDQPIFDCESLAFLTALACGCWIGPNIEEWADSLKSYSRFLWNSAQHSKPPRSPEVSPDIQFCHHHLMILAQNLHVFSLKRGYYGLSSPAIRQDDVCAFIFGVSIPMILRQVPDAGTHHYIVIGPAYIVSNRLNRLGLLRGLHVWEDWMNWDELRENEGWTDWGLKEEKVILL